jgi:pimeloyl-ACP methyl ester carboxylesterase
LVLGKIAPLLKDEGHEVVTFDLLGHGNDQTPLRDIALDGYVQQTIDALEDGSELSILVGTASVAW